MALSIDVKDLKPILGGLFGGKGDEAPPPQAPAAPAPPPPPRATPAVAGFSEWSADPMNQQKVAHGITPPGQPIIPQSVRQQATQMASLNPPNIPQGQGMASLAGPPNMPAPSSTSVTPAPSPLQTKLATDQAELQRLQSTGSGASQIKNKPGRIAAEVGDVAASILMPRAAAAIPGTTAHNYMLQDRAQGRVTNDQASIASQSQADYKTAQAETAQQKVDIAQQAETLKEQQAQDQLAQNYAKLGFAKDANGNWVEDPNSPITKQRQQKDELLSAQVDNVKAQKELRDAQAAFAKAKNDPNSPLFKQTAQRLAIAQQNANAAVQRAQAYMGRYMQSAYGTGLNGEVLAGTPIINDEGGKETPVGTANAKTAINQQGATVTFNDLQGSAAHARAALDALHKSGTDLTNPLVIAAMQDPTSLTGKMVNGKLVKPNLSQPQIEAIGALNQLREQAGILRVATKGTAAEAQVERVLATIPGAGDTQATAINKMDELNGVIGRVRPGVTRVQGGHKVSGLTSPPAQGGGDGIPDAAAAQLKEGVDHTFGNGQVWTKKNGKPVRVK